LNILALDSSDKALSIALYAASGVWYIEIDAGTRHSELLLESTDRLLKIAGLCPCDLNLVACMKGPGSFTGLRIAYSAAKGLAMALEIPLAAVPTLDCIAYSLSQWPGMLIPAIDAKQACFFTALYRGSTRLTDYLDASAETLAKEILKKRAFPEEPLCVTGSGAALLGPRLSAFFPPELVKLDPAAGKGRARELLEIVKDDKINHYYGINSGPVYLRKSDAELNSNRQQAIICQI
jgi:tRNA threonylcarbamoyladenosine biosynthesis protein TsaB